MKLTPQEIRDNTFGKSFRGYDKDAVDQYLSALANEWQKGLDEMADLANKFEISQKELNRLKDVESVMLRTIKEGDDNARKLYEDAQQRAEQLLADTTQKADAYLAGKQSDGDDHLAKAEAKAAQIIDDAEAEKVRLLTEANATIASLKQEIKADIESSEREYKSLDIAKQQLLYDLNSLLGNTTDRLTNIQTKYAPEVFDAKKVSLSGIANATIEVKPKLTKAVKPAAKTKVAKAEKSKAKQVKAKDKPTVKPKAVETKKAPVAKKVKLQAENDIEDDGLPTVQKILALEEVQSANKPEVAIDSEMPIATNVEPHFPADEQIENVEEGESKSFFDTI
jgi:DivIVA domain-containing protein